jgi:hypothetical protein
MSLCSIKNPEQLKQYTPNELGKLMGLNRIPEVGRFRKNFNKSFNNQRVMTLIRLYHAVLLMGRS